MQRKTISIASWPNLNPERDENFQVSISGRVAFSIRLLSLVGCQARLRVFYNDSLVTFLRASEDYVRRIGSFIITSGPLTEDGSPRRFYFTSGEIEIDLEVFFEPITSQTASGVEDFEGGILTISATRRAGDP